jgi:Ca2+-binding RTX toxin-like protein
MLALAVAATVVLLGGPVLAKGVTCGGGECRGTKQADAITGSTSDDEIFGGRGDDKIDRHEGRDVIRAGGGDDTVVFASGDDRDADTIFGGKGDDLIFVGDNGLADVVDCGPGTDEFHFDQGLDTVANCEDEIVV